MNNTIKHLPTDIFKLIIEYAWCKSLSYLELEEQLCIVDDIQDSISPLLLITVPNLQDSYTRSVTDHDKA